MPAKRKRGRPKKKVVAKKKKYTRIEVDELERLEANQIHNASYEKLVSALARKLEEPLDEISESIDRIKELKDEIDDLAHGC